MNTEQVNLGEGIYTVKDISILLGIPKSKARYWVNAYVRKYLPAVAKFRYNFEPEKGIFINFRMLIQIYVFQQLKIRGFQKKQILQAYDALSKQYETKYPFALQNIYTSGRSILFLDDLGIVSADGKFQLTLELIKPLMDKIGFDENGNADKFYPKGNKNSVVANPKIQFGSPVLEGTRVNAKTIYNLHIAGEDHDTISNIYKITKAQIKDAIDLYAIAA